MEKETIEAVYDRHADRLFRLAYSVLLSKEDAEDAVHDVFAGFLRKAPKFQDAEHEKAWFIRVTINQCHDLHRRKKVRHYTPLEEISQLAADGPQEPSPVLSLLLTLPEKYKTPLLLYYFEDCKTEEISRILRITQSAVKMRLARGREQLKALLRKEDADV